MLTYSKFSLELFIYREHSYLINFHQRQRISVQYSEREIIYGYIKSSECTNVSGGI